MSKTDKYELALRRILYECNKAKLATGIVCKGAVLSSLKIANEVLNDN